MEVRQLRQFDVLAQEMHFGRAAERLCVSQPALSASLARLEAELGIRLFDRDSRSVRITSAGELMLRYAREMLNQFDRTLDLSRALVAGRRGRLEIGFSGILLSPGLDDIILRCRRDFSDIDIHLREISSQKQVELLQAGRLDGGFVSLPQPPCEFEFVELLEDRFVACLPAGHRLAGREAIEAGELRDEPFVFLSRERAPMVLDQLLGFCAQAGFTPRIVCEPDHVLSAMCLVARGFGVSLLPRSLAAAGTAGTVFVPVAGAMPHGFWYFAWNGNRMPPGLDAFIDRVREFVGRAAMP